MSACTEDVFIDWVRFPCFYQKGLRDYRDPQQRNRFGEMTGEFLIFYKFLNIYHIFRLFSMNYC